MEHRDRLAGFGVEHFQAALAASGRRLVVPASDLVHDITEALASIYAPLYGQRAAKNRAARAIAVGTGETAG